MKKFLRLASLVALSLFLSVAAAGVGLVSFIGLVMPRPMGHGIAGYLPVDTAAWENVSANGIATCRFDSLIGRTVDRIVLQLGGTAFTKAMITQCRILANEKVIFDDSGSRIDTSNTYRGLTANAAFLTLDFAEIRAHTNIDKYAGSLDTIAAGVRKLTAEVTIAGATAPTLASQAQLRRSPQSTDKLYNLLIGKRLNKTYNFGAAGEFPMALAFPRHAQSFIKRVHLFGATVTAARVKKTYLNNVTDEIFKATDAQNDFAQTEFQRTPQANQYTIDFIPDGDIRSALPMGDALALEWLVTVSGAGNVTVVTEMLDPLSNN